MVTALLILAAVALVVLMVGVMHQMCGSLSMLVLHTACGTFSGLWSVFCAILNEIVRRNE